MEPFIGSVMMFGGNFAPRGWAFCEGQLLAISSNSALFSILGTVYGGDGRTTFGLPDLRGRVAVQQGNGPGLSSYRLGQKGGAPTNMHTLLNLPSHNHTVNMQTNTGAGGETEGFLAAANIYAEESNSTYGGVTVGLQGGQQSVNNMQPFIAVYYIIALQGIYPSRN